MTFTDWLESHQQRRTVLLEVEYLYGGSLGTLYLSNRPFTSYPTDTPANTAYDDVILSGLDYARSINGLTQGEYLTQVSSVRLALTPELDAARNYSYSGQKVRVYLGDEQWERKDYQLIATLTAEALAEVSKDVLELQLLTASVDVDQQVNVGAFESGPNSGKTYPVAFGDCLNVQPLKDNDAGTVYRVHDGPISNVIEVRDNGSPTSFTVNASTGTFTLSSAPQGLITADVVGLNTGLRDVLRDLLGKLGVTYDNAAIDALPNPTVALYSGQALTYRQAFDSLLGSIGAFWGFNRLGVFTCGVVSLPFDTPKALITPDDIALDGVKFRQRLTPVKSVSVLYDSNYTIQENRPEPGRYARAENEGIENVYPDATVREIQTALRLQSNGQAEADRRALFLSAAHFIYTVEAFAVPFALNVGDVITLDYPYFIFKGGVPATILSITDSPLTGRTTLEVLINGNS
ncbi:MAG: hypothetical protein CMK92_05210 [Pseudomonas sp.]|nr:hypothetical protein [Pseudomonas sp.]